MNYLKLIPCFYLPALLFLINKFVIVPLGAYQRWWWFDIPMHFLGGILIAYSLILVLRKLGKEIIIKDRFFEILIIVGLFSSIAIYWEFYEYAKRMISHGLQNSLADTLLDLLLGLVGGFITATIIKVKPVTTKK